MPDAQEYIMVKTIAQGIDILSTDAQYPVSVWQLHRYLAENCEEARGEASSTFFKTSVPKALDQMVSTCMLSAQPEGLRLTERGRRILLRVPNSSSKATRREVCAPLQPAKYIVDYTKEGLHLTELVRLILAKRGLAPPRPCPAYITDLYLGEKLRKVVAAGDDALPYFGRGLALPCGRRVIIKKILDALVRAHALEWRTSKTIRYYELGPEPRGVQIRIEWDSEPWED
jgi:hypothetical protein